MKTASPRGAIKDEVGRPNGAESYRTPGRNLHALCVSQRPFLLLHEKGLIGDQADIREKSRVVTSKT